MRKRKPIAPPGRPNEFGFHQKRMSWPIGIRRRKIWSRKDSHRTWRSERKSPSLWSRIEPKTMQRECYWRYEEARAGFFAVGQAVGPSVHEN